MTAPQKPSGNLWRFTETPPLTGEENMRWDTDQLALLSANEAPPIFRLFSFSGPTITYGRLQKHDDVKKVAPPDWPLVQRPTAGGIVLHQHDLCLSLCWRRGTAPLPTSVKDVYGWIHHVVQDVLLPQIDSRMAACCDTPKSITSFDQRQCFKEPVGYDILVGTEKIVGGALAVTKNACLYQGSIQTFSIPDLNKKLHHAFTRALTL